MALDGRPPDESPRSYGGCGPRLNEPVHLSEWLGKEGLAPSPKKKKSSKGETIAYEELIKRWQKQRPAGNPQQLIGGDGTLPSPPFNCCGLAAGRCYCQRLISSS